MLVFQHDTFPQKNYSRNFPSLALDLNMIYFSNVGTEPLLPFASGNIFSLYLYKPLGTVVPVCMCNPKCNYL